jgi:benzoyl-CoA reductase/2-hydroxyglutaryl-CoA dehydratase subunit BcrC/BadD/HgdB
VKLGVDYDYFLCFPKKTGIEQVEAYTERLLEFKNDLESAFGVRISEKDLREAIDLYNETRRLQRKLYDLRKTPNPPLSGADTLAVMMAGSTMQRREYNKLLAELLEDVKEQENYCEYPLRVFVYGGEIDSIPFLELIESQGALIVGDSLGYGYRAVAEDVKNTGNALYDLAYNLIIDRPEPRLFGTADERQSLVETQMKEFNASAVIVPCIQNCDYWGFEKFNFGAYAKQHDIPTLDLSIEYDFENSGQIKTRVQAFVETCSEGR